LRDIIVVYPHAAQSLYAYAYRHVSSYRYACTFSRHRLLGLDLGVLLDSDVFAALEGRDEVVGELGTGDGQLGCLRV
jgi:hypothetical protein